ncbi:hypothetical protein TKK_0001818 [Trichogramma kaykai]|uniref:pseudouridine 5'-phosphatase n=1 Tax=Trichogramma kaykai TaxID=54128 RepID=A0ABD2XEW5_9HYME
MCETTYKNVTHCIFDMDGLLIDTEQLYTTVFNRLLSPYGKEFTWAHKGQTMGFHTHQLIKFLIDTFELPMQPDELHKRLQDDYKEIFPTTKFLPERVYKKVYGAIVQKYGHEYGGTLVYEVLGRPEKVGAELIISHYKLPLSIDEFSEMYRRLQIESFHEVDMMPGAEKLLRHLKKHNIPIALATSSSEESFNLKTKHLTEVFDLFHHKVLGGSDPDVKIGKPNPDIFLVAARRFPDCPDPSKCLVFEDAPNGVQAGVSAGMQTVMVPDPNLPKEFTQKATIVLNSLEDFKPEQFGLPKFD